MYKEKFKTWWLYVTVFITGAAVLVIEILGTRVLAPFYGSTIFVWSSLITVTLGALALGYLLGGRLIDKFPVPRTFFAVVFIAGVFLFIPMKIDQWVLPLTDSLGIRLGPLVATGMLFALPLFLLGMVGPMVIRLISRDITHIGSAAGRVFAVATLGSIAGALLAGFFLLMFLSLAEIFQWSGFILLGVAIAGFFSFDRPLLITSSMVMVAAIAAIGFVFFGAKYEHQDTYTFKLYHQEQSHYGDLKVMSVGGAYCLTLNGFTQSCTDPEGNPSFGNVSEMAEVVNGAFTASLRPESFRALLLGAGAGDIPKKILSTIELDIVEIDPQIVTLAREYFNFSPSVSQHITIEDGRRFLRKTQNVYDVILFDAYAGGTMPPHFLSTEFFRLVSSALKPEGVLVMNIGGRPSGDDGLLMSIMRTAKNIFPSVAVTAVNPENNERLQGMILYAARHQNYVPHKSEWYRPVVFDVGELEKGVVLTDDYSPVDFLAADTFALFRKNMKIFGGYKPFFSL